MSKIGKIHLWPWYSYSQQALIIYVWDSFLDIRASESVLWIWLCLSVNPFTSPFATQERPVNCFISCLFISINVIIIVIIFFLHVVIHKVRKVRKFDLFEKSWRVRRALKDIPIGPRPSSGVDLKKLPVTVDQHVSIYLFI